MFNGGDAELEARRADMTVTKYIPVSLTSDHENKSQSLRTNAIPHRFPLKRMISISNMTGERRTNGPKPQERRAGPAIPRQLASELEANRKNGHAKYADEDEDRIQRARVVGTDGPYER